VTRKAAVAEPVGEVAFRSAAELREVLESLLRSVDRDEQIGPPLRAAHIRTRFEFIDMDVTLNVASSEDSDPSVEWSFDEEPSWNPKLVLRMDSAVANRWLQGRESIAIALARGRVQCAGESRSALSFLPTVKLLCDPYRNLLASKYDHLRVTSG
jgi:hypothetical protein